MAGIVRWNKSTTPAGPDGWNLTPDIGKALDTANVIVPVATQAERDALTPPGGKYPGMTVARMDITGCPFEIWDGLGWKRQVEFSPFITTDTNWQYGGGLIRTHTQGVTMVQLIGTMKRVAGGNINFSSTTDILMGTYIPPSWCPPVPASAFVPVATGVVHNGEPLITVDESGKLILHIGAGSMTIAVGATLNFHMGWYQ